MTMKDFFSGIFGLAVIAAGIWAGFFWHPEHAQRVGFLKYQSDPGYSFVPDAWIPATQWSPGVAFPRNDHVLAADQQDYWKPIAGYEWSDSAGADSRETGLWWR